MERVVAENTEEQAQQSASDGSQESSQNSTTGNNYDIVDNAKAFAKTKLGKFLITLLIMMTIGPLVLSQLLKGPLKNMVETRSQRSR